MIVVYSCGPSWKKEFHSRGKMLHLFTNVITMVDDNMIPVAKGVGSKRIVWLTAKARTNGFTLTSSIDALESGGFRIPAGNSIDIPISDVVGKLGIFSLEDLYWCNTVAGSNAVIELIGMRDI